MKNENCQCEGTSYSRYDDSGDSSLCPCLAITPNLVVHSRLRLRLVNPRKAPRRSIHRLLSCVYKFLLFWLHNPHFYGEPVKRPQPVICDFSRDRRPRRRMNAFTICICRTLTDIRAQRRIVTVSDGRGRGIHPIAFLETSRFAGRE